MRYGGNGGKGRGYTEDLIRAGEIISSYEKEHGLGDERIEYLICTAQWIMVSTERSAGMGFHLGGSETDEAQHTIPFEERLKQYRNQIGRPVWSLLDNVLQGREDLFHRALAMAA